MRFAQYIVMIGIVATGALGGCDMLQSHESSQDEGDIRAAAREFARAIGEADPQRLHDACVVDANMQTLDDKIIDNTVASRKIVLTLAEHFGYKEQKPGVVGSETWCYQFTQAAASASIQRVGSRARLGRPGLDGGMLLRHVDDRDGGWKVELIPTLVVEAGGKPRVDDPAVEYRLGVSLALNAWMLERLAHNEFKEKADFDAARGKFWIRYLRCVAAGADPRTEVLATLPEMPHESASAGDW